MMENEIKTWITEALLQMGKQANPLSKEEALNVVNQAKNVFVENNPRSWWLAMKLPKIIYDSKIVHLDDIIPSNNHKYWFVPETEEINLPVFDLTINEIKKVLSECPFFEYYIIQKDNQWLIAESDHNEYHVCCVT